MIKSMFFFLICLIGISIKSFSGHFISPQERAYLFHVVKKNQVLDRNIGQYFFYEGEIPSISGQVDFDSLEQIVSLEPTLLDINFEGIKRAPESILAETSSKMALWKLVQILDHPDEPSHQQDYKRLLQYYHNELPDEAYKDPNRKNWHPQIKTLLDPDLSLLDKRDIVEEIEYIAIERKLDILVALDNSYKWSINQLTHRYFDLLGGSNVAFDNLLLAAGEGSKSYGLMEEFEKKENGTLNKSQPKGIGLFTYQYSIKKSNNGMRDIYPKTDPVIEYRGFNDAANTNIHLSIWGFNDFFQTTVVIKNGWKSYILYANRASKELSADSAFAYGKTYYDHIKTLENKIIPELKEELHGSGGLWEQHGKWEERRVKYYDEIRKSEVDMRRYEMEKNRKKLKKAQDRYLNYNRAYEMARNKKRKTFRRIFAKKQQLEYYEDQLYYMNSNLGSAPEPYVYEDSIFKFEDGSYFDPFTQDFHFSSIENGEFSVRLISIGSKPLANLVDEVQLMVNAMHISRPNQIRMNLNLTDAFASNSFSLESLPETFEKEPELDSLINHLVNHPKEGNTHLFGGGVGNFGFEKEIISDTAQTELSKYPGLTKRDQEKNRMKPEFRDLRTTRVKLHIDGALNFTISSYTDAVVSGLSEQDSTFKHFKDSLGFETDNQLLSCLRSLNTLEKVIEVIQHRLAQRKDIDPKDMAKVSNLLTITRDKAFAQYLGKTIDYKGYRQLQSSSAIKAE